MMAAPYCLGFRAAALTLRAGLHSQPLMLLVVSCKGAYGFGAMKTSRTKSC
jgi:hypothetical protein